MALPLGLIAFWTLFSDFQEYDDEGYLLASLRSFVDGGTLYSEVFTQYGPFYYELFGGLFALTGRLVGMDVGRLVVVVLWVLGSLMIGLAAQRATGRWWLGLAAQLLAFDLSSSLANEPMHPVSLVAFLLAAVALVLVTLAEARPRAGLAVAGALAAALALTKVNAGGFVLIALAFACAAQGAAWGRLGALRWGLVAAAVVLPLVLLAPDFGKTWAQTYAVLVLAGMAALAAVAVDRSPGGRSGEPADGQRRLAALVAGAGAATVVVVAVILATGTGLGDLVRALFVDSTAQREAFTLPLQLAAPVVPWAFLAVAVAWWVRGAGTTLRVGPLPGALLRLVVGVAIVLAQSRSMFELRLGPELGILGLPVLFAWVAVLGPGGRALTSTERFTRTALCAMGVLQALQAYPVAGTQQSIGALLLIVPGVLCVSDGLEQLQAWSRSAAPDRAALVGRLTGIVAPVVLLGCLVVAVVAQDLAQAGTRYAANEPLPFPSADRVRLAPDRVALYAGIVNVLRTRCPTFITYPGMNSFHEWTGTPPPTDLNPNLWMRVLDAGQQRRVIAAIDDEPRACVLRKDDLIGFWNQGRPSADGPLVRYVERRFRVDADLGGGYALMTRR